MNLWDLSTLINRKTTAILRKTITTKKRTENNIKRFSVVEMTEELGEEEDQEEEEQEEEAAVVVSRMIKRSPYLCPSISKCSMTRRDWTHSLPAA